MADATPPPEYTPAQIMAGIGSALREHDMPAVASLLKMLAVRDPNSAQMILDAIELTAHHNGAAPHMSMIDALNVERDADGNPARASASDETCHPEDHDWVFDGTFWHVCDICGAVS